MAIKAEVESSNTVGYKKLTLQPGLNLVGTGFKAIGGGEIALKNLFNGDDVTASTAGDSLTGDLIQLFEATVGNKGYNTQYYFYANVSEPDADYDYKWYDISDDDEPTDAAIGVVNGFWYNLRGSSAIELNTCGEVSKNSVQLVLQPGLNLVTYPFPADFDFTKIDWRAAGATAGDSLTGDLIQLFDATVGNKGYNTQYYFYANVSEPDADYDYKWYDISDDDEPTEDTIPAYSGFWYNNRGNSAITITLPSPVAQ